MLSCKSSKFTLDPKVTYLNCAYMSPMLKRVEKAGLRGLRVKRNPHLITPENFYSDSDLLRKEFAKLINANDHNRIAIIASVSYGMSTVAKNLRISRGEEIIVAADQFPSNYYPWQSLCNDTGAQIKAIGADPNAKHRGRNWNEKILDSIKRGVRAVAIANTHWADGTKFDLMEIRKRTRDVGALLVVDGTQSVGALPFDAQTIQPDALVCAGYKWLLGPYSIGLAYYGEYFNDGRPLEENWINRLNSENFSGLVNYEAAYQPGALRYEVGEHSNFILVPMMLAALKQINRWHVEQIQGYCSSITEKSIETLIEKGFWVEDKAFRGSHLFGIRTPKDLDTEKLKAALTSKKIYVSFRGDAMRVSPNVYNNEEDMRRFTKVLTSQLK